jgi:hypothetical protein
VVSAIDEQEIEIKDFTPINASAKGLYRHCEITEQSRYSDIVIVHAKLIHSGILHRKKAISLIPRIVTSRLFCGPLNLVSCPSSILEHRMTTP